MELAREALKECFDVESVGVMRYRCRPASISRALAVFCLLSVVYSDALPCVTKCLPFGGRRQQPKGCRDSRVIGKSGGISCEYSLLSSVYLIRLAVKGELKVLRAFFISREFVWQGLLDAREGMTSNAFDRRRRGPSTSFT